MRNTTPISNIFFIIEYTYVSINTNIFLYTFFFTISLNIIFSS
ncbi:hypothetical protein PFFVO_01218 [Plasmodium falciparum Vietnam Oak-Knoll (FVO)]|uniref:Uncharacterized protein n=1 Tax=Plasmodium falciparum Vietnam Oak-Knoll (FVO) TaxID=1036723 RepID=A0A024VBB6_PLAFA|nr:hypothetical protein PFFVO_01218 [Plasmodium falciparum Vietnam Oak-Knoll (FVO)]